MSWLWSTPPADGDPAATEPVFDAPPPPSSATASGTGAPADFGSAFADDDVDISPPERDSATFSDNYLNSPGPSTDFASTTPDPFSSSPADPSSSPAIDFSSMSRINPAVLSSRPAFSQSPSVDYVFADDYKDVRKKSPAEQLTFLCGASYMLGGSLGAASGLAAAIPASAGKPARLRVNAALNAVAKRGTSTANAFGVLALSFCLGESLLYNLTNDETVVNYAGAGAIAGALYKSTRGLRPAAIWGAGGAAFALATVYASRQGYYGRGLQGIL